MDLPQWGGAGMNIIGIVGTALIAAIFAVTLKRYNQEYAVIISIIAGVVILVEILRNILYRGVWTKYQKIQKERQENQEKNGK